MANYAEENGHLPIYGVGPVIVVPMMVMSALAFCASMFGKLDDFIWEAGADAFYAFGIALVLWGLFTWANAAFRIDKYISTNTLCTDGIYAWVRNPCYSGAMLACDGVIFFTKCPILLVLPLIYWLYMTVFLKNTEEKWLRDLYKSKYEDYCKDVNRCLPFPGKPNLMYQSKLSGGAWAMNLVLLIAGMLMFLLFLTKCFVDLPRFMENSTIYTVAVLQLLPVIFMLVGVLELFFERKSKLSRHISEKRLYRGYGMLVVGGMLGMVLSLLMLIVANARSILHAYMTLLLFGSFLCLCFSNLILKSFKRTDCYK